MRAFRFCPLVVQTSAVETPDVYSAYGVDNSFRLEDFKANFKLEISEMTKVPL